MDASGIPVTDPRADTSPILLSRSALQQIDEALRQRLASSVGHLAEVVSGSPSHATVLRMTDRLGASPVSPWTYALYATVVTELTAGREKRASELLAQIEAAAHGASHDVILAYRDTSVPDGWWSIFDRLFDTDPQRTFRVKPPSSGTLTRFRQELAEAMSVLEDADPEVYEDTRFLLRMVVPASPASTASGDGFNGASTFFLWGAALFNADIPRGPAAMIDLLVHEAGHLLLFGLVEGGALTKNPPGARYTSPLRSDPRPIDGIFHAGFVATRVHLAMTRLLAARRLPEHLIDSARDQQRRNAEAALNAISVLSQHAIATPKGAAILEELHAYWRRQQHP